MARILHLDEGVEHLRQHVLRNAAARIGDGHFELLAGVGGGHGHGAFRRELDRVPDKIEEDLAETVFIQQNRGHPPRAVDEFDSLLGRGQPERREDVVGEPLQQNGLRHEGHLARIHLRQVEDVVHELQERGAAGADGVERLLPLGGALAAVLQEFGIAEDGVERRPDIVAHDTEKHAPGPLGGAGPFEGPLEFGHMLGRLFALDDRPAQFGAFVLDDEDVEQTGADETAESIIGPERPGDLEDDGHRHGEAEEKHHHVPSAGGIPTAERLDEHENSHQDIKGDQRVEQEASYGAGAVTALLVEVEKTAVEDIDRQQHDIQSQKRISEPVEHPRRPAVQFQIGDDETAPCEHGGGNGDVVAHGVDVQDLRPAESREDAPPGIGQIVGEDADQEVAVLAGAAGGDQPAPGGAQIEVDDEMDRHRQKGDHGINIVLHTLA